ncbi:energy transducer TonB [Sphingomonas ginsenosidimutans]|uniref:energy transducer TonB n=4 Tax=Sphingomonas TaxID=13687 RepID=UPI001E05823C|nr:energy transducer TonB [Sphingomonas ginsenosidimutans]MBY0301664.1 energy transducer TonB [Sphingomonas ginsenosidimutans]
MTAAVAILLAAQTAGATPPAATLQARFDAANEAQANLKCAEAIRLYTALEQEPKIRGNALASAAIAVRKGICLVADTTADAGEASIRRGLPTLEAKGAEFEMDVARAYRALGDVATMRFDYPAAAREYRRAVDRSTGGSRAGHLLALSRATMFDGDGAGVAAAGEALRLALDLPAQPASSGSQDIRKGADERRETIAAVRTQYARALLNMGRNKEAYDQLKASLREQGGLTTTVGFNDISTRSDLAIAAKLAGDMDAARTYLSFTGAGRIGNSPFQSADQLVSAPCGGEAGLKPGDVAVVEFSVETDGHVSSVSPIYTTAGRGAATAFAQAAARWSWQPDSIAKVPALFRYLTRVEMRCTRASERPSLTQPLQDAAMEWLATRGAGDTAWRDRPVALAAPIERAALAKARSAGDDAGMLAALLALASNGVVTNAERNALAKEAVAVATRANAPVAVRTYAALTLAHMQEDGRKEAAMTRAILSDPVAMADPLTAATVMMLAAQAPRISMESKPPADVPVLTQRVIDLAGLPDQHPLKVSALLQRANQLAKAGDLSAARALFDRTGLTEEQCAMIEPKPDVRRSGFSARNYPMEALRNGFEGWVQAEFDIAADGTTVEPRATVAYPPFVFDEAAVGMFKATRFTSSYRPAGSLACAANRNKVIFRLP